MPSTIDPTLEEGIRRMEYQGVSVVEHGDEEFLISFKGLEQVCSDAYLGTAIRLLLKHFREVPPKEDKAEIRRQMARAVDDAIAAGHPITRKREESETKVTPEMIARAKRLGISL